MRPVNENFKRIREKIGLSPIGMAEKLDVSQSMVNKVEKGHVDPSLRMCYALADLANCSVPSLFERNSA